MNEISYRLAVEAGLQPITYRLERLGELGKGEFSGRLDALVWASSKPAIMAMVSLDDGTSVCVMAFQEGRRDSPLPYQGLRMLSPGESVVLEVDFGPRGGVRPTLRSKDDPLRNPRTATREIHDALLHLNQLKQELAQLEASESASETEQSP